MMRPEEVVREILRKWWIIAIAAIVAAGVAYGYTASQPKEYTVNVRVMAIADPPDYWMDLYAKNRLASYRDLINNWDFVAGALKAAELDIDPGLAQSKLQLGHTPDTNVVQIVVVDTDAQRAADIANALAAAFEQRNEEQNEEMASQVRDLEDRYAGRVNMVVLETATPPSTPSGPRVRVNTVAGGILGALAGAVVVFLLIYRDDTLKSPTDLERYLGEPLLATVPD